MKETLNVPHLPNRNANDDEGLDEGENHEFMVDLAHRLETRFHSLMTDLVLVVDVLETRTDNRYHHLRVSALQRVF